MYLLITHTDLDGIGCAILAKLFFKNDIEFILCKTYKDVNEYLEKINIADYNKIFITDITCDEKYMQSEKILLFDHHKTSLFLNQYKNCTVKVTLNNKLTCGAELFYQYLLSKGLCKYDYFVELIRLYDTWEWINYNSKIPYYLNNLIYILGTNNFINSYVEKLQKHDLNELNIFSNTERILLEYQENQIQNFINNKKPYIKTFNININNIKRKIGICFAEQNQSILGNTICKEENIDIMIMINLNYPSISFRTELEDIDVSMLAKKINISGGGHKKAAGSVLSDEINTCIYQYIIDRIQD